MFRVLWVPTGVWGPPTEIRSPQTFRSPQILLRCRSPQHFVSPENWKYHKLNRYPRQLWYKALIIRGFQGHYMLINQSLNVFSGEKDAPQAKILKIRTGKTSKSTFVVFHDWTIIIWTQMILAPGRYVQMTQVPQAKEGPPRNIPLFSPQEKYLPVAPPPNRWGGCEPSLGLSFALFCRFWEDSLFIPPG